LLIQSAGKTIIDMGAGAFGEVIAVHGGAVIGDQGTPCQARYAKKSSDEEAIPELFQAITIALSHQPGIIKWYYYHFNTTTKRVEVGMELADGTLKQYMRSMGNSTKLKARARMCIGFLREVAPTLKGLHSYGVVQVDIKPGNIGLKPRMQEETAALPKPGLLPLTYVLIDLTFNVFRPLELGGSQSKQGQ
jgi:serine/threonine protein kinase